MTQTPDYKALADDLEALAYERRMIEDLRYFTIPDDEDNAALIVGLRNDLPAILSALRRAGEMEAALRNVMSIWDRDGLLDKVDPGDVRALDAARSALKGTST